MENPFQTLGVGEAASADEIKRAYRRLALRWHPDRNDSPEAADRFAAVTEAYRLVSDPAWRAEWEWEQTIDSLLLFRYQRPQPPPARPPAAGADVHLRANLTLADVERGKWLIMRFKAYRDCGSCSGHGRAHAGLCDRCSGEGRLQYKLKRPHHLEPGFEEGIQCLRGHGNVGVCGGLAGDLYLHIKIASDRYFRRDGPDLHATHSATLQALRSGIRLHAPLPGRGVHDAPIPPGTAPGSVLVFEGGGLPRPNGGPRGNLVVRIRQAQGARSA